MGSCSIGEHATRVLCEAAGGVWSYATAVAYLNDLDLSGVRSAAIEIVSVGVVVALAFGAFAVIRALIRRAVS